MHALGEPEERGDLIAAITAWQNAIGPEHVSVDAGQLAAASTTTFATTARIPAIIRPATREQVQRCVRIAQTYRVPLYPVSRGRNWGYGSRVPASDGCVLMELFRLDRILEYDEPLGYVRLEPGVSYRQLHEFLRDQNSDLMLSVTGSTPEASLIGNTLERGVGNGPYGDHAAYIAALEIILPSGEQITTGFGRFGPSPAQSVYPWGIGPSLDGLFLQSNLGIVVAMTIWLAPAPAYAQVCHFGLKDGEQMAAVIDAVRELKMRGILPAPVSINNDLRLLAMAKQYPWEDGDVGPPRGLLDRFHQMTGFSLWSGAIGLYSASSERGQLDRDDIARALLDFVDSLAFVDGQGATVIKSPSEAETGQLCRILGTLQPESAPLLGVPTEANIGTTYWRKRDPVPKQMDPDRDRCGFIWLDIVTPLRGADVTRALAIMEDEISSDAFDPMLTCICQSARAAYLLAPLVYDREPAEADERARACITRTRQRLMAAGYFPPRLDVCSTDVLTTGDRAYQSLLDRLKRALDPNDILAPGRYGVE